MLMIPTPQVWRNNKFNFKNVADKKKKILVGFKKAHSLLGKIIEMTEKGQYCIDIMQQNLAAIGLVKSAHQQLMENHLNTCFKSAMESKSPAKKQQMTKEILQVTRLFNK